MKTKLLFIAAFLLLFISNVKAQTAGTLTFTYTPIKHLSNYETDGRFALAIWIESCAICGSGTTVGTSTYVRTKIRNWGNKTTDHLPTWASKSGSSTTNAISGATTAGVNTLTTGTTYYPTKTITWDGTNAAGTTALSDGNYRVCVQETWDHGSTGTVTKYFPFNKSAVIDSQTPAADTSFSGIILKWVPTALMGINDITNKPEVTIYPNPTNGIFNMDFKNDVNSIRIVDILGKVVYSEKITSETADTTKRIDLSNLNNGLYIVSVTNDNGTSNYKVILNK